MTTVGKEGLAFSLEGGDDSLAQMLRFLQQVIEMAKDFAKMRRLNRIHGDRRQKRAIGAPQTNGAVLLLVNTP